jgi:hypothetical protein
MNQIVRYGIRSCAITGFSLLALQLQASAVIPAGTVFFSSGQVTASAGFAGSPDSSNITPPQNTGTATQSDGTATSTTVGTFSTSGFAFSFTQGFPDDDQTAGTAYADFIAGPQTSYALTDPDPFFSDNVPPDSTFSVDLSLFDISTETFLYDTAKGGNLTGELTSGDEYELAANAQLQTISDPTLTYNPSVAFTPAITTPENPAPLIPLLLGGLALLRGRLRRFTKTLD